MGNETQVKGIGRVRRRRAGRSIVVATVVLLVLAWQAASVLATTGGESLEGLPIYRVTAAQARPFVGYFKLAPGRAQKDKLRGAWMTTEYDLLSTGHGEKSIAVLQGSISLEAYDATGQLTNIAASLYEYHEAGGYMRVDLFAGGSHLIGRLKLRPTPGGRLAGLLAMFHRVPASRQKPHQKRFEVDQIYPLSFALENR